MMNWLQRFTSIFIPSQTTRYVITTSTEHPIEGKLKTGVIHIVQYDGNPKWAYLRCPCPKHDVIRLNLSKQKRPCWSIKLNRDSSPDVSPSIWQLDGCYSHFWIRDGRVAWARGSGSPPKKDYWEDEK